MARSPRTQDELGAAYESALLRLRRRCDEFYEEGAVIESASVAALVRVLVHDTTQSVSLLTQMGAKNTTKFLGSQSTGKLYIAGIMNGFYGLHARTRMPFRACRETDMYEFDTWWTGQDFSVAGHSFTRKELILAFANQEGGAHVDPNTDQRLQAIRHSPSPWTVIDGDERFEMRGAEHGSVCAIGEEVLFSLTPEPENRTRMIDAAFQKPFYLSREVSDRIKTAIQADIVELENLDTSGFTSIQNTYFDIALRSLRWGAEIDHLNGEHAAVRESVRRDLSAKGIEMSALPDAD